MKFKEPLNNSIGVWTLRLARRVTVQRAPPVIAGLTRNLVIARSRGIQREPRP